MNIENVDNNKHNKKIIVIIVTIFILLIAILLFLFGGYYSNSKLEKNNYNGNIIDINKDDVTDLTSYFDTLLKKLNDSSSQLSDENYKMTIELINKFKNNSEYKISNSNAKKTAITLEKLLDLKLKNQIQDGEYKLIINLIDNLLNGLKDNSISNDNYNKLISLINDAINNTNNIINNSCTCNNNNNTNNNRGTSNNNSNVNNNTNNSNNSNNNTANNNSNTISENNTGINNDNTANNTGTNTTNNESNNNTDDKKSDMDVDDSKTTWSKETILDIFANITNKTGLKNKIAPEDEGEYNFAIRNNTGSKFKYSFIFNESNEYNINLKYKIKKGNTYITNDWKYINEIDISDIYLNNGESNEYTLVWKWVSSDNDTAVSNLNNAYSLKIMINAEG